MAADPRRAVRDPIHGLVPRYVDEIRIMNTGVFQRLRRIRQLALAHYVYPGALHTRFDHSVGTMHLAGQICNRLKEFEQIDDNRIRIVRLAALLHDIGHGPFSHVSEYVLEKYSDRDQLGDLGPTGKIHERITADVIGNNAEIAEVLSEEDRRSIIQILGGERGHESHIVSSSLDADKMDYLLRDSYFAGVQYGQFDLNKIIDVCRVHSSGNETYLVFDQEGVYALEQLVIAKYHMGQQVYYHRVRAITDAMLVRGLKIAVEKAERIGKLFRYDGSPDFMDGYLRLHDELVIHELAYSDNPIVSGIFTRLLNRRLFKEVASLSIEEVENSLHRDWLSRLELDSAPARELEAAIAADIGCASEEVIVTRQSVNNPTFRMPGFRLNEEEILILDSRGIPRSVRDYPDLVFNLNTTAVSKETIKVFAPRDHWGNPENPLFNEREELNNKVKDMLVATG